MIYNIFTVFKHYFISSNLTKRPLFPVCSGFGSTTSYIAIKISKAKEQAVYLSSPVLMQLFLNELYQQIKRKHRNAEIKQT